MFMFHRRVQFISGFRTIRFRIHIRNDPKYRIGDMNFRKINYVSTKFRMILFLIIIEAQRTTVTSCHRSPGNDC